jgi:hypothetical protein
VPPLVGFYAKLAVLQALIASGQALYIGLAVFAVMMSLVAAYLLHPRRQVMYFDAPITATTVAAPADVRVVLTINGALVLVLGILPGGLDGRSCAQAGSSRRWVLDPIVSQAASVWLVLVLAFAAANLPFLSQRVLVVVALADGKNLAIRLAELVALYFIVAASACCWKSTPARSRRRAGVLRVTARCSSRCPFPGFVWRYLFRHGSIDVRKTSTWSKTGLARGAAQGALPARRARHRAAARRRLATREFVLHPGRVAVVPLLDDGRIVLERQFRHAVRRVMIEIPAGKLDPGEGAWPAASASCSRKPATSAASGPMPSPWPDRAYSTRRSRSGSPAAWSQRRRSWTRASSWRSSPPRRRSSCAGAARARCGLQDPGGRPVAAKRPVRGLETRLEGTLPSHEVLNLQCAHGHGFEGWFGSEDEFQDQLARGLVECPLCGDVAGGQAASAPRLNLGAAEPARARSSR